jgi:hypothetical protein
MNQEIAVHGFAAHRYFLVLRKYLMLKIVFYPAAVGRIV